MAIHNPHYTTADVRELYTQAGNEERRFELIEGELYEMAAASPAHAFIGNKFGRFLDEFVDAHDLGYVFGDSCSYILSNDTELIPDCSFVVKARLPTPLPKEMTIAPDLAVKVISPGNRPQQVEKKIRLYFKFGSRMVIAAYPEQKRLIVHQPNAAPITLSIDDVLDGGDVLPGFRLNVRKLFPKE